MKINQSERVLSLDAFRGITIASMILVNTPGSWSHVYAPLRHAEWHGWTPTDLIFPFFLFIVGVAMSFSFSKHLARGMALAGMHRKVLRRSVIIFALGLFMAAYPFNVPFDLQKLTAEFQLSDIPKRLATLRIPGVLQRIAVCYLVTAVCVLRLRKRGQYAITVAFLVAYWAVMKLVPVPGYQVGDLTLEGNLARYVDLAVLGADHMYRVKGIPFDPEGLLSTVPAISTTLLGVFTGDLLRRNDAPKEKARNLLFGGLIALSVGKTMSIGFPINKQLWSPSYVLLSAGWALLILAACYWAMDVRKKKAWAKPFVVFGSNSIFVFAASGLVVKTILRIRVPLEGQATTLYSYLYRVMFVSWAGELNGSLLFAITWILLWLGILWILYVKRIFIKI